MGPEAERLARQAAATRRDLAVESALTVNSAEQSRMPSAAGMASSAHGLGHQCGLSSRLTSLRPLFGDRLLDYGEIRSPVYDLEAGSTDERHAGC
jgi:hypothetical protein